MTSDPYALTALDTLEAALEPLRSHGETTLECARRLARNMTPDDVFTVLMCDRHYDPIVEVYATEMLAIERARQFLGNARWPDAWTIDDRTSHPMRPWIFRAYDGDTGSVTVEHAKVKREH